MGLTKIKKGLDLPLKGSPDLSLVKEKKVTKAALLGDDYVGLKPTFEVQIGDEVKLGQLLFTDKKMPGVKYTSPGAGKVIEINRGEKRAFKSIVIELTGDSQIEFKTFSSQEIDTLDKENVKTQLIDSGLWTAMRARPFSRVANPEIVPDSIFITSIDTNPLAPSLDKVVEGREKEIEAGVKVLSKLTDGKIYFCKSPELNVKLPSVEKLQTEDFAGLHPAGLVGTHIHFLDPVGKNKTAWYLNIEDVIRFGILFLTGKISVEQTIAIAGPSVKEPCLVKTRIGADLTELTKNELTDEENRIITGSVFSGLTAEGITAYLGRFHRQVSVLPEGNKPEFLGWLAPGSEVYSVKNTVISKLFNKALKLTTALNGGHRAIVPIGSFEKVMPLDIIPTYLLRALSIHDVEESEQLGCLELDEEDLALCTFVCPSKNDYGTILRETLTIIEKEG